MARYKKITFSIILVFVTASALIFLNDEKSDRQIVWKGKAYQFLTYGRVVFKNTDPDAKYGYFIVEPKDVISDGGLRYSPTTRKILHEDLVEVTGKIASYCFWTNGVDNTKYNGCVPWVDAEEIKVKN